MEELRLSITVASTTNRLVRIFIPVLQCRHRGATNTCSTEFSHETYYVNRPFSEGLLPTDSRRGRIPERKHQTLRRRRCTARPIRVLSETKNHHGNEADKETCDLTQIRLQDGIQQSQVVQSSFSGTPPRPRALSGRTVSYPPQHRPYTASTPGPLALRRALSFGRHRSFGCPARLLQ